MSIVRIRTHKFTLKPFYKGYILKQEREISRKQKIILLRKLYFYFLKMSQNDKSLKIDEDSNIDEAIYFLFAQFSDEKFKDYIVTLNNGYWDIGIEVPIAYDSGVIPLRAFYDQRKNKPFYNFLLKIVAYLKHINCSVFNDSITDMAKDVL